jgi:LysR family glycine cleavage system transcriptional activator
MRIEGTSIKNPRILRSLQYFESVARLGSVKAAAAECSVSASAVSHQLRELNNYLGEEVLVRSGRGIRLTGAGEHLYRHVSSMFADLDHVLEGTVGRYKSHIRLAVCSSFGPAWLAKRLPDFLTREPETNVELRLFSQDPLQTESTADVIVTADDAEAGFDSLVLFEEMLVAVGSPSMPRDKNGRPAQLITTDLARGSIAEDWLDFCKRTGKDYMAGTNYGLLQCTHYLLAIALAEAGVGAALVPDFLAADAIKNRDLVLLNRTRIPAGRVYKVCFKMSRAGDPAIRSLRRWLKAQAEDYIAASTGALEEGRRFSKIA